MFYILYFIKNWELIKTIVFIKPRTVNNDARER